MSILDHFGFSVADYAASRAFYDKTLAAMGITALVEFDTGGGMLAGYGIAMPEFWINQGEISASPLHFAFAAKSRAEVDAFYASAMAAGGKDNGAPGLRTQYHPNYYGAFVFDPDGHNVEAVCHAPA